MAALSCVNTKHPLSEPLRYVTMTERLNRVFVSTMLRVNGQIH
jgi:hypothetical protein